MSEDKDIEQAATPVQEISFAQVRGADALRMAEELSLKHLNEVNPSLLQGVDGIWTKRVKVDEMGMAHTRMLQTHQNIPVFGGEAIVHLTSNGSFKEMTDKLVRDINVNTTPKLTELEALDVAVASEGGWSKVTGTPMAELNIIRVDGVDHLAYLVKIDQFEDELAPAQPFVFVDAHTGDIVNRYNNLKSARNRRTHTANNGTSLPGTLVLQETSGSTTDAVINQAHTNAGHTYDYYSTRHGRDSFNGAGATITSTVHYSRNYVNAFWNGTQMVYGDGDGSQSGPLTVLDVVGHELTHAVTDYESDLIYQNESGALNEAMSDIFAAAIESWVDGGGTHTVSADTWKVGEDCWTPATPGDALRYMNNPNAGGDYDYYPERYTGTSDNGGVHWNSGIANLAFYLLSQGGTHPRNKTTVVVPAIGIQKAADIFYRANANYLSASSNFEDARAQTAKAAADLFGASSAEVAAVHKAWDAVGVPGGSQPPPSATEVFDGQTVSNVSVTTGNWAHYFIQIPAGASNFTVSTTGGTGDADLYVKFGSTPTTSSYDCRPYLSGNAESCTFAAPQTGSYFISIRAYSSFSGLSLTVNYDSGSGGGYPGVELTQANQSGSAGSWKDFSIAVPADANKLTVKITGGTGDADLYVRKGAAPTTSTYDCRPYASGNEETCSWTTGAGGATWYISIRGYSSYSGVTLTADYDK